VSRTHQIKGLILQFIFIVGIGCSQVIRAGDLSFIVTDSKGKIAPNAVITLRPLIETDWSDLPIEVSVMKQKLAMFTPFVLAVRANTPVSFPNLDQFRHQVYSFSKAKQFKLRLYGMDESKKVTFDKAGVVALGCNIHDNMLAYIYVTDNPYFTQTNEEGEAVLEDVRSGEYELTVWHPDQKKRKVSYKANLIVGKEIDRHSISIKMRSIRRVQKLADPDGYLG